MNNNKTIPLSKLKPQQKAKIHGYQHSTSESIERLKEYGLVPGETIAVFNKFFFNGPIATFIRGSLVGIRRSEADNILVEID